MTDFQSLNQSSHSNSKIFNIDGEQLAQLLNLLRLISSSSSIYLILQIKN